MSFVLIALLIASLVAGGGTVYASQGALPGDALYGVKMVVEDMRLLINTDEIGDAQLHLEFATERLEEATTLVAQGRADFVEDLMAWYAEEMEAALAPLADGVDEEEMDLLDRLAEALAHHQTVLAWVLYQVPQEAQPAIEQAIAASDVVRQVLEAVGGAVPHEPPTIEPPTILPPTVVPPTIVPPTIVPPTVEPPTVVPPEETPTVPEGIPTPPIPTVIP